MNNICKICGQKKSSIFTLKIPDEFDSRYTSETQICGGCWDSIAYIANKSMNRTILGLNLRIDYLYEELKELKDLRQYPKR